MWSLFLVKCSGFYIPNGNKDRNIPLVTVLPGKFYRDFLFSWILIYQCILLFVLLLEEYYNVLYCNIIQCYITIQITTMCTRIISTLYSRVFIGNVIIILIRYIVNNFVKYISCNPVMFNLYFQYLNKTDYACSKFKYICCVILYYFWHNVQINFFFCITSFFI